MGQKVNPISLRLGYIKGWDSNWFANKKTYSDKLMEDHKIRSYVSMRLVKGAVSKIIIERTLKKIILTINTAKPGIVIGKGGSEVDKIKEELKNITKKEIQINIFEIKKPEIDSKLIADSISFQLKARSSFRKIMKQFVSSAMKAGAKGVKIRLSGRLGGAEMARSEQYKEGRVPLHTFRANIGYSFSEANTSYGKIGIKVWIFYGEIYDKKDLFPNINLLDTSRKRKSFFSKKNR